MLNMAYILDIKNPNKEPVMLDELSFTTAFDGFDVNTANEYEHSWIPGGKTNQLKVITTNETLPNHGKPHGRNGQRRAYERDEDDRTCPG